MSNAPRLDKNFAYASTTTAAEGTADCDGGDSSGNTKLFRGRSGRKRPVDDNEDQDMFEEVGANTASPSDSVIKATRSIASSSSPTTVTSNKPPPPKKPDTKAYRGLRHFSMMVCKKVEEKGTTSYSEVADELVATVIEERRKDDSSGKFDEKNIRRRVYDALNVLMAMDIITKDKKAITWKGLPTSASQDLDMLRRELEFRRQEVTRKRQTFQELLIQQVCFRNLVEYNHRQQSIEHNNITAQQCKIPLPFIVVNTHSSAVIQCNMSRDLTDVMFDFSMPFEINDDNTILKRLGMHKTNMSVLREMLPDDMIEYCQTHDLLAPILVDDGQDKHKATSHSLPVPATTATNDYQ